MLGARVCHRGKCLPARGQTLSASLGDAVIIRRGGHAWPPPGQFRDVRAVFIRRNANQVVCRMAQDDPYAEHGYCTKSGQLGMWSESVVRPTKYNKNNMSEKTNKPVSIEELVDAFRKQKRVEIQEKVRKDEEARNVRLTKYKNKIARLEKIMADLLQVFEHVPSPVHVTMHPGRKYSEDSAEFHDPKILLEFDITTGNNPSSRVYSVGLSIYSRIGDKGENDVFKIGPHPSNIGGRLLDRLWDDGLVEAEVILILAKYVGVSLELGHFHIPR